MPVELSLFSDIIHRKLYRLHHKLLEIINVVKLQDTKSVYRKLLNLYTLINENYQKEKLIASKKNKFNQGGERLVHRVL